MAAQPDLLPVVRTTTAQTVAARLLEMIRQGAWRPGDQLPPEKELMEKLAVGRSTVREALQILATLNVVHAAPGHGTFVKEPNTADLLRADVIGFLIGNSMALELLEAREMIEPSLVRLASIRGTEEDFARIERLLDEHEAAHKAGRPVSELASRFHVLVAEASHNRVGVIFMTSILELLMNRGRRFDDIPDYQARELADHRELFRLIKTRDPEAAAEFLLRHIVESAITYDREGVTGGRPLLAHARAEGFPQRTGGKR